MLKDPVGFSRDFSGREAPCIGVFGGGGVGKTRFLASAGEYAVERNKIPGWLVCDRKTRRTVREVCTSMGLQLPLINDKDFIEPSEALRIAKLDRESDKGSVEIQAIYSAVMRRVVDASIALGSDDRIDPIIFETGTQVWDWISYAHFGRKQGVGKSRVWGPPKQDWTDLMDGLAHKTVLLSFWEKDAYRNDERAGYSEPDGPKHIDYTTTTLIRLNCDQKRKLKADETYEDRFSLDVYKSQENKGIEGTNGLLTGSSITYANLMMMLLPEE